MKAVWIIGAGKFGLAAARRLSAWPSPPQLTLVDPHGDGLDRDQRGAWLSEIKDGVTFLCERLWGPEMPDWIIPALPLHLIAEFCLTWLGPERLTRTTVPEAVSAQLPNPLRGTTGDVYVSIARFRCPPDCPEPPDYCTVTRQPRPEPLYSQLAGIRCEPLVSIAVRSQQLAPGVGGYRPETLKRVSQQVASLSAEILLSTACSCHGVITAVKPVNI